MADDTTSNECNDISGHRCDDALADLYLFLDGELDAAAIAHIRMHLEDCSPCFEAFDFEAELRTVVAARCQDDVPEPLRQRVLDALTEAGVDPTDNRPG
jgi:mycothiol system anti-sigma-R factor